MGGTRPWAVPDLELRRLNSSLAASGFLARLAHMLLWLIDVLFYFCLGMIWFVAWLVD